MKRLIYLLIPAALFAGCRSAEEIAARKAQKEAEARQKEMALFEKMRREYPCDTISNTIIIRDTTVSVVASDTTRKGDTVKITTVQEKVVYRDNVIKILDQSAMKSARDSTKQALYNLSLAQKSFNDQIKRTDDQIKRAEKAEAQLKQAQGEKSKWKRNAWITWVVLAALVGFGIVAKVRNFI